MKEVLKYYSRFFTPEYKTAGAAAVDLCIDTWSPIEAFNQKNEAQEMGCNETITIPAGWRVKLPTGFFTELPNGSKAMVILRSSVGWKKGLQIPNSVGLIDADYRGEWFITLYNPLLVPIEIQNGERIAQAIFDERYKWVVVDSPDQLQPTERGAGGFGSTGK